MVVSRKGEETAVGVYPKKVCFVGSQYEQKYFFFLNKIFDTLNTLCTSIGGQTKKISRDNNSCSLVCSHSFTCVCFIQSQQMFTFVSLKFTFVFFCSHEFDSRVTCE